MKYSKEEISSKIVVPSSVEVELKRLIENKLNQTGIFYRVFSRTKTPASLERKYSKKDYSHEKKIQDLIGIRINLYFQDDIKIVKRLMENLFIGIEWAENVVDTTSFEPTKVNGVFKLPPYLVAKISEETWQMAIDQTFEIQLKTVFFEGWHEVEHDMRYKHQSLWEPYGSYARKFNSIVATLELCDRSMVDIFEDLAHSMYKANDWMGMIRMHYRIRISEQKIYDEFIPILEENDKELGKKLFRYKRGKLIEYLSSFRRDVPISVNMIIAIINDRDFQDERIKEIAKSHRVYHDGISDVENDRRNRTFRKMNTYIVYSNEVTISSKTWDISRCYDATSNIMYKWLLHKYIPVFPNLPKEKQTITYSENGYSINLISEESLFEMNSSHIDQEIAGRIWHTYGKLEIKNEELKLTVKNSFSDIDSITTEEKINHFSAPGFYSEICRDNNLCVIDVVPLADHTKDITDENGFEKIQKSLIKNPERNLPVVIIVYRKENNTLDKSWLPPYWASDFARAVKNYCHVYECVELASKALQKGVYLYYPTQYEMTEIYSEDEINNWRHTPGENGILKSRDTEGSKAFMNDLIRTIKKINILTDEEI